MSIECRTEGCTVGETAVCLLNNDPETCEFRIRGDSAASEGPKAEFVPPVLDTPQEKPTLWGSLPLDLDEIRDLMSRRRCLLVGVVGTPAAGKTAALVSMYLLLSHAKLKGYQFADSLSLPAFEEVSQGARRWGPSPPEEMTARTETSGGRVAGFLHVRVKHLATDKLVDFLVPDLPGEWSDTLIDSNRVDRLQFLYASDVIWVFVNGADLRTADLRMHTLNRTGLLLRRVSSMLGTTKPPVKIVVSHADEGALPQQTLDRLKKKSNDADLDAEILHIASFSENDGVVPGVGIAELIESSMPTPFAYPPDWPEEVAGRSRFMLRYAGDERA